jgi:hypothetical protein
VPFVFSKALEHLMDEEELDASEREALKGLTNIAAVLFQIYSSSSALSTYSYFNPIRRK